MAEQSRAMYRSGFCGSGQHGMCPLMAVNGSRAASRYAVCACDCHREDPGARDAVVAVTGAWPVPHPDPNASMDDLARYLEAVNLIAVPVTDEE
jgi:hypothetical protein